MGDLHKRTGKFYVSLDFIQKTPEQCMSIMQNFLVVDARANIVTDRVEYFAMSPLFDIVEFGDATPEYRIEITSSGDGSPVKAVRM